MCAVNNIYFMNNKKVNKNPPSPLLVIFEKLLFCTYSLKAWQSSVNKTAVFENKRKSPLTISKNRKFLLTLNRLGGLNLCIAWGGVWRPHPHLEKGLRE